MSVAYAGGGALSNLLVEAILLCMEKLKFIRPDKEQAWLSSLMVCRILPYLLE